MKRTNSPKTKTFVLPIESWCILMASFNVFAKGPHSSFFRDFILPSSHFKNLVPISKFRPSYPVKNVEIILHYE